MRSTDVEFVAEMRRFLRLCLE